MASQTWTFDVPMPIYGIEALYLASYAFLDRAYVWLEGDPAASVKVKLQWKEKGASSAADLAGEFRNELLHQALRVRVSNSNQKLREYIVTRALASAEGAKVEPGAPSRPPEPLRDEELEKEIEKLLAEVEQAEKAGGDDPLKILGPQEKNSGGKKEEQEKNGQESGDAFAV
jgi:His-Xaa-Ser system protein HxsD